jgi:CelD/BcsL family acetyltransferase involved in cellulose biosynthesis
MAEVIEINDLEELQAYRLAWNALLPQTPRASFFHTFDWFENYWNHYGQDLQMRVMVVEVEGKPIGIVPLVVRDERYHTGTVRVLTYPLSDWGMWYGPIGPNTSASLFMAMRHVRETARDWDLIDLRWAGAKAPRLDPTGRALWASGWNPEKTAYQQSSLVELEKFPDWAGYLASRTKKWRHELRRQCRALEDRFEVTFERFRPEGMFCGDDTSGLEVFDECLQVSLRSWQATSPNGNTLCHPRVSSFLRDCHESASRLGMVDVTLLRLGGRAAAFQYNYHYNGRVFGLRIGYAEEFAPYGVGKALLAYSLADSYERGDRVIDLGEGDYPFKRRLRTATESSNRYLCYPWLAWRGQTVRLSRWVKTKVGIESLDPVGKAALVK